MPSPSSRVPPCLPACLPHLGTPPQVALENQSRTASWAPGLGSRILVGTVGTGRRAGRMAVRGGSGSALGGFSHHQCVQDARSHCVPTDRRADRQHALPAQAQVPLRAELGSEIQAAAFYIFFSEDQLSFQDLNPMSPQVDEPSMQAGWWAVMGSRGPGLTVEAAQHCDCPCCHRAAL